MNQTQLDPYEEFVVDQLCAYQVKLDHGLPDGGNAAPISGIPAEVVTSLQEFQDCLDLLNDVRSELDGGKQDQRVGQLLGYQLPDAIGRFQITEQLGVGGYGIVFRAFDPLVVREVAIKIPRPEMLASSELIKRFADEASAVAQLDHPNIVAVYESSCDGVVPYIVMPFIQGPTLAQWRKKEVDLKPRMAAEIVRHIASGIAHAHERGILHRDLKSGNILLSFQEQPDEEVELPFVPKVTDFGLAKCSAFNQDLTRTGTIIGTACYMSPEQAEGRTRDITARSDVYGLGAILYELLTGAPPFCEPNELQSLRNLLQHNLRTVRSGRPGIPVDLEAICMKCLERSPARRYDSARALSDDLDRFRKGEAILARSTSPAVKLAKWCRRHPKIVIGLSATLVGLIVILMLSFWYNTRLSAQLKMTEREHQLARRHELEARRRAYTSEIRNAWISAEQNDLPRALKLLDRYRPHQGETDLRDFTWWHLWREYNASSRVLGTHDHGASTVAVARNGSIAASSGGDSIIRLWKLPAGTPVGELHGHESGGVESLDFSPGGNELVSAGADGTVRIWDLKSLKEVRRNRDHRSIVYNAIYSPDGNRIATGGSDMTIRLLSAQTGETIGVLNGHCDIVRCLAFHPSEPILVSGSLDRTIRIWNISELRPDERIDSGAIGPFDSKDWPRTLAFEPNGESLLCTTAESQMIQYDWGVQRFGQELHRHDEGIIPRCLLWTRDQSLVIGRGNSEIHVATNARGENRFERLVGHRQAISALAMPADETFLISASKDGTVRFWPDFRTRSRIPFPAHSEVNSADPAKPSSGYTVQWFGDFLAADYPSTSVSVFSVPMRKLVGTFPKDKDDLFSIAPTGGILVLRKPEGLLNAIQLSDGQSIWTQQIPSQESTDVSDARPVCDRSGNWVAVVCDQEVFVLSMRDGAIKSRLSHSNKVNQVLFREQRGEPLTLISAGGDGYVRFWNAKAGTLLNEHRTHGWRVCSLALTDDQGSLATVGFGSYDCSIRIWKLDQMTETFCAYFSQHPSQVNFLADGILLFSQGSSLKGWNTLEESELFSIVTPLLPRSYAISPDRHQLAIPREGWIQLLDGRPD